MRRTLCVSLALVVCLGAAARLAAEEADGWLNLLPGGELAKYWNTKGNWKIDSEGVVALSPREGEKGWSRWDAYLWLGDKQYDNFEFQFDYMCEKGSNSGFYFHVGDKNSPVATGVEVQIYDSGSKPEGAKLTDHDSGGIIPGLPPTKNAAKPAGEWNHFHITVKDNVLNVKLNGEVVNEVDMSKHGQLSQRPATGFIGFQDHALPLKLRNLKIRSL
ncbi:MAG: DUF1080 domain-containing protein [Planctomycetales bacterium]|nr:DUF1080 domain-containing protein [Planctomycetales bacterium]